MRCRTKRHRPDNPLKPCGTDRSPMTEPPSTRPTTVGNRLHTDRLQDRALCVKLKRSANRTGRSRCRKVGPAMRRLRSSKTDVLSPEHYAAAFELQAAALEWSARWESDRSCDQASAEYELLVFEARPICYLWPLNTRLIARVDADSRDALRRWYLLGADAFGLASLIQAESLPRERSRLYQQLARCVSAIRTTLDSARIVDEELSAAHGLLRTWAERDSLYIHRHMKHDDPADPRAHDPARDEFEALRTDVHAHLATRSRRVSLMNRIHGAAAKFADDDGSRIPDDHWRELGDLVAELINDGEAPTSIALRTQLAPILDCVPPDGLRSGLRAALNAARPAEPDTRVAELQAEEAWSGVVDAAREKVAGQTLLIVGGQDRPDSMANIERALACRVLHECPGPHASLRYLADTVRGVGIVLLLIRFASHSFKPQLTRFCRAADTPLVIVPAGYGVEQVATAIMDQASLRL